MWLFQILKDPKKDANHRQDVAELWAVVEAKFIRGRDEAKKIGLETLKVRRLYELVFSYIRFDVSPFAIPAVHVQEDPPQRAKGRGQEEEGRREEEAGQDKEAAGKEQAGN